jgi:hypothetical protein
MKKRKINQVIVALRRSGVMVRNDAGAASG